MSSSHDEDRVDERVEALYRRHRALDESHVSKYYESGRGYIDAAEAGEAPAIFALALAGANGRVFAKGDADRLFPLQSISKVFVYGMSLEEHGRERVLERVGVEPSGDAFNSLTFDERANRPHNPMVNAGALVTTDMVSGGDPTERFDRILDTLRRYAANPALTADEDRFAAELRTADRNRATAYLMRSDGMLEGDIEATLALYLRVCSVQVTTRDLAVMAATLAHGGVNPVTGERAIGRSATRDVLSVMHTCGMYDFAGEWAFQIGVPAKSGVSGGVLASVPGKLGIGVFSPGLDQFGNSVRGTRVCADVSERLGLHVFAASEENALLGPADVSRGEGA